MYEKRKAPIGAFFVLLIVLEAICYVTSGICNVSNLNILNLEESLKYTYTHPAEAWNEKTPAFLALGIVGWFFIVTWYLTYFRNYHDNPYGSDEWRDVYEANVYYRDKNPEDNRVLTQNLEVSLSLQGTLSNNNMGVFASSGCYKTTAIVEQNILRFGASYVILDVKGELQRKWARAFLRAGFHVNSLNFKEPHKSDQYNPFEFIENEADILRVEEAILEACRPNKDKSMQDPFWDDALKLWSGSLYSCEWLRSRETGKKGTMNGVMELASWEMEIVGVDEDTNKPITKLEAYMNELADKYGSSYPPVRDYNKLKKGAPDTVRSVILMFNSMLKICETAEVKRIFEGNDINIRDFGTGIGNDPSKKSVLFLCVPDDSYEYNWIISLFYTQALNILNRLSDNEVRGPLPVRVEFWLDELYNGCRPANIDKLLGIVRGRNISLVLILQSLAQLQALYPEKWKVIMDNLAVVLFAGSGPAASETHEYFSKLTGKSTIDTRTDNIHHGYNANTADNFNQMGRELMTPTEIRRMPTTKAIVFIEASNPIYDTKAIPFHQPLKGYMAPRKLRKWYSELRSLGDYEHPVYTVYDEIHFHYITVKRDEPMKIVTNKKDIEALQHAAITNDSIYTFNVDEEELLYLSWGGKEYTQENVEAIYKEAMKDAEFRRERLKGLIVLQDVEGHVLPGSETNILTDKSSWDKHASLKTLLADHWDDLSAPEQEEFCFGIDDGLTEEQLRRLILCSLVEMSILRRAFVLENQGKG